MYDPAAGMTSRLEMLAAAAKARSQARDLRMPEELWPYAILEPAELLRRVQKGEITRGTRTRAQQLRAAYRAEIRRAKTIKSVVPVRLQRPAAPARPVEIPAAMRRLMGEGCSGRSGD